MLDRSSAVMEALCSAWFNKSPLISPDRIDDALSEIDIQITADKFNALLQTLISPPFSDRPFLELVLSTSKFSARIESCLVSQICFPLSPLSRNLLIRLSNFLFFSPFSYERKTTSNIADYRRWIEHMPAVFDTLKNPDLYCAEVEFIDQGSDEDYMGWGKMKQKVTQRQKKQLRKGSKLKGRTEINLKPFNILGISVPKDELEAEVTLHVIITKIKQILQFFLEILRNPDIAASIIEMIVVSQQDSTAADIDKKPNQIEKPISNIITEDTSLSFPVIQPMKAALYFDSVEGFGEWRILISTRGDRDLRTARRKDAKFFKIVVKKIKELSNGHFSDDNQKRLSGLDAEIPIYEAKMTRDSRLVYQVDCIPEYDSQVERQVLKIFGIYTHAQINNRLWDSLSRQLGRKGKQYRDRCTYRNRPYHPGDSVIKPAFFPPLECQEEDNNPSPNLPQEDLEEIHSLLVLEKFVTFSQALLNSIMADLDVAHVFNVTPPEKQIIEHPTSCYVLGRSGTGKTTTMLFKMLGIERAFDIGSETLPKPRQLFVTQSRVLATKVEEYFMKLLDSLSAAGRTPHELVVMAKQKKAVQEEDGLVDVDDTDWRADLPSRFSLLEDRHFPLFLTFDRLLQLLEADMDGLSPSKAYIETRFTQNGNSSISAGRLITYDVFLQSYWPHFSQSLTKGLDPSLVFSELLGVIKGSEEALAQDSRFLDKITYEKLSHRAQYSFATQRDTIYAIFNAYLKQKRSLGDFDAADRTHRVLQVLQLHGVPGLKLDYLYVDEAQDNLLIDAFLLRLLCRNPNGLFWAGDTAQTISVGSCFRFNDLKAFLFRLEHRKEVNLDRTSVPQYLQEPPKSFQLAINYRSHGGIVQCAQSVIDLITTFWPYAIDILSGEKGVVSGSKPVFFSGWDQGTVRYEQFLFGTTGSRIEFGAQQCILVRSEVAKDELKRQVGDIGLIMTLYESKGLEFDDVLLYKFFEDSTVDLSQWRVVLNLLQNPGRTNSLAPRFDEARHAGVCSELKFLYVAITRARKNLWIVDCSEKGDPMKTLWSSRNQVQSCTPGTDVPRLAVSSSPEEWEETGKKLFQRKRYLQAMHCFERAGLSRETSVAHTYYLREQARMIPDSRSRQEQASREQAFLKAAEAFIACACEGSNIKEKRAYFRAAGNCFEQAQNEQRAAQAYYDAEEYTDAAKLYRKCGLFDEAVDIVASHRSQVTSELANSIIDVARLFYYKENKLEKAGKLFSSTEEELDYLEEYDFDVARADVLHRVGRYKEAAEIHLAEGRTFDAIQNFLKEEEDEYSIRRAADCILQGLWDVVTFGITVEEQHRGHVKRLLQLASQLKQKSAAVLIDNKEQFDMFAAIMAGDRAPLRDLGRSFASTNYTISAALCFEHYFRKFPAITTMKAGEVAITLGDFLLYTDLLNTLWRAEEPCNNRDIQQLFGFRSSSDNAFFLPTGTYLHKMTSDMRIVFLGTTESGASISEADLTSLYRHCLGKHIRATILQEDAICRVTEAFSPCLPFAVFGYCNRAKCPRQHTEAKSLTPLLYNLQVKIHMQQILIIQSLHASHTTSVLEQRRLQRYWLDRTHQILYPPFYCLGTISNLNISSIPEAPNAIRVIRGWIQQIIYFHFHLDFKLSTTVYHVANLAILFDRANASTFLEKAPILSEFLRHRIFMRSQEGHAGNTTQVSCIMHELVESLQAKHEAFISIGILFVRQVIDNHINIHINVLCDFLDYLCGSIILVQSGFNPHNKTLPRSWFVYLLLHLKRRDAETSLIGVFMEAIGTLLKYLVSGEGIENFLFENTDISKVYVIRNIFISRICRTLGLLGYNINNDELKQDIMIRFKQIRSEAEARTLPAIYRLYAEAKKWQDIVRAIRQSTINSTMDGLVQLRLESAALKPILPIHGVQQVLYKAVEDVPRLLSTGSVSTLLSDLRVDAPTFVPRIHTTFIQGEAEQSNESLSEEITEEKEQVEELEVDTTVVLSTTALADSIANNVILETNAAPSQEQLEAAMVFLKAYRKAASRRKKPVRPALDKHFMACLSEFKSIEWSSTSQYRFIFLGPLPHALACLSALNTHFTTAKQNSKKRLKKAVHQELENLDKKITEINGLFKKTKKLQELLQPNSQFHRKRDLQELKCYVLEVEMLMQGIPASEELRDDLAIAIRGIVTERNLPEPQPKPDLVVEDEDMGYDII